MANEPVVPAVRPPGNVFVEAAFAGLSSALLFALFLVLPIAGSFALAFAGVPLVRLTHRRGLPAALAGSFLAAAVLGGLGLASGSAGEALAGATLGLATTLLPVVFSGLARRGMPPSRAFLLLAAVGFALLAGVLLLRERSGAPTLKDDIGKAFDAMSPAAATPGSAVDGETSARMAATFRRFKEFAQSYWLGLVGASWAIAAAISFYFGARAARPAPSAETVRFEALRLPAGVVALFVAAGAAWALLPPAQRPWAGDLLIPLSALYFLTGLSLICHFARKWFRARILRAGLYALVVYFPLNVGVGLLGIFDWYADFRRRGEKAERQP